MSKTRFFAQLDLAWPNRQKDIVLSFFDRLISKKTCGNGDKRNVCCDTSAMNQSNRMIPGARENWRSLLYNESKNIENRRVLFAGDDFENIAFL